MEYATFKKWLAERGCRFYTQAEERGEGHGTVTIHCEGRTAELPLVGARHELDPRSVKRVCEALGLKDYFPGPKRRLKTARRRPRTDLSFANRVSQCGHEKTR